jgi:hypothetical protein
MSDLLYWSDTRPLYLTIAYGGAILLFLMAVRPGFTLASGSFRKPSWIFLILLGLWMVVARWPGYFYFQPYDPDEAQTLAAAQTLAQQPILYRFADGASAGPLVIYGAGLPWIFGMPPSLLLARLTAVLFGWIGVSAIYFGIRSTGVELAARLSALTVALFYAFTEFWNYVHYNSEMLPSALCACATACMLWMFQNQEAGSIPRNWKRLAFIAALVLSLVPFSKLQLVPLALLIGLMVFVRGLWILGFEWRPALAYMGQVALSVLIFPTAFFLFIYLGGSFDYFYHSYLANNLLYAASGYASHGYVAKQLLKTGADMIPWIEGVATASVIFFISGLVLAYRRRPHAKNGNLQTILCIILAVTAGYCVLAPSRDYIHYLLLLPMPLGFALGTGMSSILLDSGSAQSRRISSFLVPAILILLLAPYLNGQIRAAQPWAGLAANWAHKPKEGIEAELIKRSHDPGDGLLVWGYHPELNVTTGIHQATRLSTTSAQIQQNALTPYYRTALMEDLRFHPPRFIVDDVCASDLLFKDHSLYGPQCFHEFKEFLDNHYQLIGTYSGMRLYESKVPTPGRN